MTLPIVTAVHWMLRRDLAYADLGADYFDRIERIRLATHPARRLNERGSDVTMVPC